MARSIEEQGAILVPDSRVLAFYENKQNMHNMFCRVGVRSPQTFWVRTPDDYDNALSQIGLPFIMKGAYGFSSKQISLVETSSEATKLRGDLIMAGGAKAVWPSGAPLRPPVLLQEYLDIRRDLRIIFVGERVLLSYWRINTSKAWKSTTTSAGSKVVFEDPPARWLEYLMKVVRKIDFPWGAFDVAWQHDDLVGEPYILEVSPCFEPNPPPPPQYKQDYYAFKYESIFDYSLLYQKVVRSIADAQIELALGSHTSRQTYNW